MQDPTFVKSAFSEIAAHYGITNHILSGGIDILWRRRAARLAAKLTPTPARILDLATGNGDLASALRARFPHAHITGADFCQPMLEQARGRGLDALLVADAMDLPFPDATFDLVTVGFGLRNMASYPDAAAEMRRVIAPGGHLIILDFSLPDGLLRAPYRAYLHHVLPRLAGWITRRPEAYRYLATSIEQFPSGTHMEDLLTAQAGFASATTIPLTVGIASLYLATSPSSLGL